METLTKKHDNGLNKEDIMQLIEEELICNNLIYSSTYGFIEETFENANIAYKALKKYLTDFDSLKIFPKVNIDEEALSNLTEKYEELAMLLDENGFYSVDDVCDSEIAEEAFDLKDEIDSLKDSIKVYLEIIVQGKKIHTDNPKELFSSLLSVSTILSFNVMPDNDESDLINGFTIFLNFGEIINLFVDYLEDYNIE